MFCRFHKNRGHYTNKCRHLRDVVENYIRMNKLPQFVRGMVQGDHREQQAHKSQAPQPQRSLQINDPQSSMQRATQTGLPHIAMISGRPHEIETSRSVKEKFAKSLRHEEEVVLLVRDTKRS